MTKNGTVHNSGLNEANHLKPSENDCMGEEDIFIIFRLHLDNIFPSRGKPTFYDFWFARKCRLSKTADFGSFWIILDHFGLFWIILDHFGPFWTVFEKYMIVPNSVPNIKSLACLSRI